MRKLPKREARAEVRLTKNDSDGKLFFRIKIFYAHPIYGLEAKQDFSLDVGTAAQLHDLLDRYLGHIISTFEIDETKGKP